MELLFGKRKTPQEVLRQNQRALQKSIRELDRERNNLSIQEKKLIVDIKKSARENQINACKIMAKDLVRTRRYIQKFYQMRTQLQAVSLRIQTLRSNQSMADALRGVAKSMRMINAQVKLPAIQKIMMDFERETSVMDMKEEMMNDAIDDTMEEEDDEEETENIVSQVLDEIGIDLKQSLKEAPQGMAVPPTGEKVPQPEGSVGSDDLELQARLDRLKRM